MERPTSIHALLIIIPGGHTLGKCHPFNDHARTITRVHASSALRRAIHHDRTTAQSGRSTGYLSTLIRASRLPAREELKRVLERRSRPFRQAISCPPTPNPFPPSYAPKMAFARARAFPLRFRGRSNVWPLRARAWSPRPPTSTPSGARVVRASHRYAVRASDAHRGRKKTIDGEGRSTSLSRWTS